MRYTCIGSVRECGVEHRTIEAAVRCTDKDRRACFALGGGAYSDMCVYREDGSYLDDEEFEALRAEEDRLFYGQ